MLLAIMTVFSSLCILAPSAFAAKGDSMLASTKATTDEMSTPEQFEYRVLNDGTAEITVYTGSASELTIPREIDGYTVTSIGDRAFEYCSSLRSVTIGNSVTKIDNWAFGKCSSLTSITISDSVVSIGDYAFCGCTRLTSITIGNSITSIGNSVFDGCLKLSEITIPEGVNSIADWAFNSCSTLTNVTISKSVKNIGPFAFYRCLKLSDITVDDNNNNYSSLDGNLYSKDRTKLFLYAVGKPDASFTVPDRVTTISNPAFVDATNLKSVTIPKSVTRIDDYALGYYHSSYKMIEALKDFTIYGYVGTAAEKYAKENSFKFIALTKFLTAPKVTAVTTTASGVKVTWEKVSGAEKYRVFRKTSTGKWTMLGDTTATSYSDNAAKPGTKYFYTVRCISVGGKSFTSSYDTVGKTIIYVAVPRITKTESVANGVKITWGKAAGAAKYRVFIKTSKGWTKIGDTAATSYLYKTEKSGVTFKFTVRCLSKDGKTFTSSFNSTGWKATFIATPALPTLKNTKSGVQISWKKVTGAAKYRIFRKLGNGKWTKLADTTSLKYVDKSAKRGKVYTYTLRCISANGKAYTSSYNTTGKKIKCVR